MRSLFSLREREVGAAQLGHAQAPDEHLDGVGHRAVGALDGDDLHRVRGEQVAQPAQLVRVVPVHPHAQADGLLGLLRGVGQHALLAQAHEGVDAVALDVPLAGVAQLPLDVDLDPQALAVEAVLPALVLAEHRVEALVEVLVGPPPGVVDGHRVVGGDGPVEERPRLVARVLRPQAQERRTLPPQVQDAVLLGREVGLGGKRTEARPGSGPRLGSRHEATRIDERGPWTGCPRRPGAAPTALRRRAGLTGYDTPRCRPRATRPRRARARSQLPSSRSCCRVWARCTRADWRAGRASWSPGCWPSRSSRGRPSPWASSDFGEQFAGHGLAAVPAGRHRHRPAVAAAGACSTRSGSRAHRPGSTTPPLRRLGSAVGLLAIVAVLLGSHATVATPGLQRLRHAQHGHR